MAWYTLAHVLAVATAGAAGAVMYVCWVKKYKRDPDTIPTEWIAVGYISEICLYPLKSGHAINVEEATCTERGLATCRDGLVVADRNFIVFDEETGTFKTSRQYPKMVLITVEKVRVDGGEKYVFAAPGVEHDLLVSLPSLTDPVTVCRMWFNEEVQTVDCGKNAAIWFSLYLTNKPSGVRLGYYKACNRTVGKLPWKKYARYFHKLRDQDFGSYADLSSYMLLGAQSVDELNGMLKSPVSTKHFRPNFVVEGINPFVEDNWDWVKLGETVVLRSVKPCTRCTSINVGPQSGIIDPDCQPLKTLRSFRKQHDPGVRALEGNAPTMGLYLGLHSSGVVRKFDRVYVGA